MPHKMCVTISAHLTLQGRDGPSARVNSDDADSKYGFARQVSNVLGQDRIGKRDCDPGELILKMSQRGLASHEFAGYSSFNLGFAC